MTQCKSCHGPERQKGGLRLDQPPGIAQGGEQGPIVTPGRPGQSRLLKALEYEDADLKMPPRGKLAAEQIEHVKKWIALGAPLPSEASGTTAKAHTEAVTFDLERRLKHWCYQPLQAVKTPAVTDHAWPLQSLDRFILARLEKEGIPPAGEVSKSAWLRRVTFDLVGLPPTLEEQDAFLADFSPQAYERVVDRLVASSRYGERWARHWLDLVRYADTLGHEFDFDLPNAWRYRNYLIRAFNDDVPYRQLVLEHLAGDLLPEPRVNWQNQWNESIQGTAFWWLGEAKQAPVDVRQEQADRIDNQIDVMGKAFLGQTLACARCHDHKFDAIATRDYYALYGVLKSSRYQQACIDLPERSIAGVQDLLAAKAKLRQLLRQVWRPDLQRLADWLSNQAKPSPESTRDPNEKIIAALLNHNEIRNAIVWLSPPMPGSLLDLTPINRQGLAWANGAETWEVTPVIGDKKETIRIIPRKALDSGRWSQLAEGLIQFPTFTITEPFLHIRAAGMGGRLKVVIDGFEVIREPIYGGLRKVMANPELIWHTFDLRMWRGRQAYLEAVDGGPGDLAVESSNTPAWIRLDRAIPSPNSAPPETNKQVSAKEESIRKTRLLTLLTALLEEAQPPAETDVIMAELYRLQYLKVPVHSPAWTEALDDFRNAEKRLLPARFALATTDGTGSNETVFLRGNPRLPGPVVPRGLSAVYCGPEPLDVEQGSGRLALANRLVDPERNPLIVRVMVNRVWQHHFGEGIVKSVDDFGHMGVPPSHPELLDDLARRFVQHGWSMKWLHREIVLSRAYRQSSRNPSATSVSRDPQSRLLSARTMRRLEAEAVRDAMLAISGRLKSESRDAGVLPYLTPLMQGRGRPGQSGPLDGDGYRSIYLSVRRNFLPPLFTAFDYPTPFSTRGRRSVSNVPAQALVLMNDPLVLALARHWARAELVKSGDPVQRLQRMYRRAFTRLPTPEEQQAALDFVQNRQPGQTDEDLWTDLAHALFSTKEFLFVP